MADEYIDSEQKKADTTSGAIKGVSSGLQGVPIIGGILSGIGTMIGGFVEKDAAKKQALQAERIRREALMNKAQGIQKEYLQKLKMDEMAALGGIPGLDIHKQALEAQNADTARAIRESSPNGAATLAAMAATKGLENQSLNELMAKNEAYKAGALKDVGETIKGIGGEKQSLQDKADAVKARGLQAASALEAASTYNKQNAINKMLGAATSTIGSLTKNDDGDSEDANLKKLLAQYLMKQKTGDTNTQSNFGGLLNSDIYNLQNSSTNIPDLSGMNK